MGKKIGKRNKATYLSAPKKNAKLPSLHTVEPAYKRLQGNKDFKKSLLPKVIPHIKLHQNRMKIIEIQIFEICDPPKIFLKIRQS